MSIIPWIIFLGLVMVLLALDLGVFNRKVHVIDTREALGWTVFWIALALLFTVPVYYLYENHLWGVGLHAGADMGGRDAAMNYVTGYLIEKALSLDNIAVIAMIFTSFAVPLQYQHRVLFWGILGALVFRGIMIAIGATLVSELSWILYIFGAFLLIIAVKTTFSSGEEKDPQDQFVTKFLKKHFSYHDKVEGMHFLHKMDGKYFITPLLVALIVVEISDIIFAVDSIPAIFGITTDPFIVFTSNIFAILGLRSLYFVLASILEKFRFLKHAVGFILFFIGVKLLIPAGYDVYNLLMNSDLAPYHLPNWASLVVVSGSIFVGIIMSLLIPVPKAQALSRDAEAGAEAEVREASQASEDER